MNVPKPSPIPVIPLLNLSIPTPNKFIASATVVKANPNNNTPGVANNNPIPSGIIDNPNAANAIDATNNDGAIETNDESFSANIPIPSPIPLIPLLNVSIPTPNRFIAAATVVNANPNNNIPGLAINNPNPNGIIANPKAANGMAAANNIGAILSNSEIDSTNIEMLSPNPPTPLLNRTIPAPNTIIAAPNANNANIPAPNINAPIPDVINNPKAIISKVNITIPAATAKIASILISPIRFIANANGSNATPTNANAPAPFNKSPTGNLASR